MSATNERIQIKSGDASAVPASFSRFILPFMYKLTRSDNKFLSTENGEYKPLSPDEYLKERRLYFTHETGRALFSRAKWYQYVGSSFPFEWSPNSLYGWDFYKEEFPSHATQDIARLCSKVADKLGKLLPPPERQLEFLNEQIRTREFHKVFEAPLALSGLYDEIAFPPRKQWEAETREYKTKVRQLNRSLIEYAFPEVTPKSAPQFLRMAPPKLVLFEQDSQPDTNLQTGFLIVDISFVKKTGGRLPRLEDQMELNGHFKYWRRPYENHGANSGYHYYLSSFPVAIGDSRPIGKFAPQDPNIYFSRWESLLRIPVVVDGVRCSLFSSDESNEMERGARDYAVDTLDKNIDTNSPCVGWAVYADNRTFVWTCALTSDNAGSKALAKAYAPCLLKPRNFGHWIKLLNVDMPRETPADTHTSSEFERAWAEERHL